MSAPYSGLPAAASVEQSMKRCSWANEIPILEDFIKASWRDPKVMVSMFTEDGGLELPYLTDFGYPERFAGAEGIYSIGKSQDFH